MNIINLFYYRIIYKFIQNCGSNPKVSQTKGSTRILSEINTLQCSSFEFYNGSKILRFKL